MNSSCHSSFPPFSIDLNEDLYHDSRQFLQPVTTYASSSLHNYPFFINPSSPQEAVYYQTELQPPQLQDQADIYVSGHGKGSFCDHQTLKIKNEDAALICKEEEVGDHRSLKWVSSNMRLAKKMISSDDQKFDHDQEDHKKIVPPPSQPDNNTVRVCSDCNTTKTPLWRSGPRGPKSLCNACGIRQRKARRAMAAAAAAASAAGGSTIFGANNTDHEMQPVKANVQIQKKDKKPISAGSSNNNNNNNHLPFKKRCTQKAARKMNVNSSKICLEDLTIILSKKYSSSFQRVFPQDEKDAAILLMALSYGALVHG